MAAVLHYREHSPRTESPQYGHCAYILAEFNQREERAMHMPLKLYSIHTTIRLSAANNYTRSIVLISHEVALFVRQMTGATL